jgi:transposase
MQRRLRLIELVVEENVSIYKASRIAGINNATAKDIIRKYKNTGNIFIRKQEIKDYQEEENHS